MSAKSGGRKKSGAGDGTITENRRARRDFEVTETFEAGLVLQGTEVKSLRQGKANLVHSFDLIFNLRMMNKWCCRCHLI